MERGAFNNCDIILGKDSIDQIMLDKLLEDNFISKNPNAPNFHVKNTHTHTPKECSTCDELQRRDNYHKKFGKRVNTSKFVNLVESHTRGQNITNMLVLFSMHLWLFESFGI